jgi:aspartate/methionine/tyrosine aminotransferase
MIDQPANVKIANTAVKATAVDIRELAERAKRENAMDLAQGIIDLPAPNVLVKNLKKLPLEKLSRYTNKRGVPEYRQAVQHYLKSRGLTANVDSIMGTTGTMAGTTSTLLADCRPGDTVLLLEPFFLGHKQLLEALGFNVHYLPMPVDEPPDWHKIKQQMKKIDALIVTTPSNPTGQVAPSDVLKELSEEAAQHKCLLIIDEMYQEFIWDNPPADDSAYQDLNFEQTVLLRSFSKTLAIPGWRVGFAVTSPERVEAMASRHDPIYAGGSTIAQYAMAEALNNNVKELNHYVQDLRKKLQKNMKLLAKAFRSYGMEPLPLPATYYMLIKHNRASDMAAMEELMARKIFVTPLNILTSDPSKDTGYIRIHFAVSGETAKKVAETLVA